ncbi:uncharacterized protein [Leptinotarsa decemlineata]|uniref:uncharacterized protein n=1 Tax=Leptinotarsa decemlineata TaxID=7539 RepID=UPI003D3071DB
MHDNYAVYVENVVKNYGNKTILKELNMKVERGIIYGLLGASGCGKTTLLSSIVGRKKIDGGEIWVLGGKPGEVGSGVPGPRVGYMPQDIALVGEFTVKDAIYYFGRIFGMEESLIAERYKNLHNLLELPPDDRYLKNCSGGQQRRVSLAASLVHKPELLIMDEPTVGVDPVLRDKIWNHLVEITKKENTSVIITTHYIEEARQANKVGLMREGKLLVEESPSRLLTIFNTATLEEVFLILSRRQEEGRLENIDQQAIADDQNNSIVPFNHISGSAVSVASVSTFEVGHGSTDMLAKEKLRKAKHAINRNRVKALMDKNWKQFYRNVTGIFFLLTFPIIQIGVFLGAVGGDIKGINLGIVNDETMSVSCPGFAFNGTAIPYDYGSCHFSNLSCRFLSYLDHPMIHKVPYDSLEEGKEGVRHGNIVGVLYMSENFTEFTEIRTEKGKDVESDVLDLSQIKVWMDMSNRQIGATLKSKLIDLYIKFQTDLFEDCNFLRKLGELPVNINFIYGDNIEPYTVFMLPGSLITIMFFMGAIMTSQIIITDRHDGVWDRSIVAGVTSIEITLTHLVLQATIIVVQTLELVLIVYVIFQQEYLGSMWLIYFMVYMQGVCGMAYGFWVSVISTDHSMANTVLTGIFLPMMMLSGLMWPTEGMPMGLRIFSRCLPFTMAIESLRNVTKKGWSITHFEVYDGIGVGLFWTLFFGILSVYLIKKKRLTENKGFLGLTRREFSKMNQNIAVHVKGVRKRLGKLQVLEGVDMEVEKGTIYGLLGASGCGKTTLLNILVGRTKLDEGEVSVLGNEYTGRQSNVLGSRVGYMPQEVALVESLTVKDTLFYFGRIYGMSDKLITERYDELHTLLELPPDNRYIVDCSGGEKRRVSFASAVIHKPELLILDEPTVGVDPLLRERIWNYLVDMTKKLGTSVIITTHYIEECRQTDKICLLRGGIILAQENPDRLLDFYNSQTLEDVFLMLSKEQDEGRLSVTRGDMLTPQDNESIASGKVTTFEINDGPEIPDKKRGVKQANGSISKQRISAMLDKNWKQFYRNRTGFLFFFFIPLSQTFFCLAGVGGNVKNIPLGIVNDEVEDCSIVSNFDDSSCRFSNMSCRFLTHLNHPMISKVKCDSLEDAIENVRRGVTAGALYIPENFSSLVEQRMDTGLIFDDDVVGDLSQVKVWMDMSNMEIGESVKYKLIELFKDFQVSVLKDCGYPPEFGDVPIKMNLIFGHDQEAFTVFMIPGVMISILFLFGSIITCQIIVTEREEGIWDRSIVAGVTSLEITISHLVLQACLALIPVIEILCLIFWIYQYTNVGSYWLLFLILYLTELSGMCYGYLVSIVSNGHIMATLFLCGSINTMILICGMIWPVEGMHSFLRMCTKFLPFTFSIEATRNVIRKGWTIDNLQVFDGILVALLWIVIIAVISVFLMKRGR